MEYSYEQTTPDQHKIAPLLQICLGAIAVIAWITLVVGLYFSFRYKRFCNENVIVPTGYVTEDDLEDGSISNISDSSDDENE